MNPERKSCSAEIKAAGADGSFEAVIATLNVIDSDGDIIVPGAFGGATMSVVPAHDHSSVPLGKATMEDRGNKAVAVGRFNLDIPKAKDWHSALRFDLANGDAVQEWSFAFRVLDSEEETRDGDPVRILKRLDIMEVSPVLRGAGVGTGTLSVKHVLSSDPRIARLQRDYHDECIACGEPGEWVSEAEVKAFLAKVEAKQIPTCTVAENEGRGARGVFRYAVDDAGLYIRDLARKGAWDLGLREVPSVSFIRKCRAGEEPDIINFHDVVGLHRKGRNQVYVASGLDHRETLVTLGHEFFHVWEEQAGRSADEKAADAYGKRFADWIITGLYAA